MPTAPAVSAFRTRLPAGAGSLLIPWSVTAFMGEDLAHRQHVEFVFVAPGFWQMRTAGDK
jgi:hypothetical protein